MQKMSGWKGVGRVAQPPRKGQFLESGLTSTSTQVESEARAYEGWLYDLIMCDL